MSKAGPGRPSRLTAGRTPAPRPARRDRAPRPPARRRRRAAAARAARRGGPPGRRAAATRRAGRRPRPAAGSGRARRAAAAHRRRSICPAASGAASMISTPASRNALRRSGSEPEGGDDPGRDLPRLGDKAGARAGSRRLRSSTTRTGERCSSPLRRQVSCGSSASTVAVPTRIASCVARSRCVRSRAAGPVIQRLSPEAVAIRPSSEVASFSVTSGRPVRTRWKNPALISAASSRAQPALDRDPGLAQPREAAAGNPRVRVLDRSDDPAHPGGDQRLGAGRRPSPVSSTVRA